ncbi:MAG: hypothetical protein RJA34_3174 [Pseudomonadota bacterium]|jgi:hypothetical protein
MDLSAYAVAPKATSLSDWTLAKSYTPLPDDWLIFVADVTGSTQAIAQGHYKQVNALGAACIVAATHACGPEAIPFVFGGDGATVVVPPTMQSAMTQAWLALSARALASTGLELRVGCVQVADVRARGADVRVARHGLAGQMDMALFSGGGLSLAEDLVKTAPERYGVLVATPTERPEGLSVDGLECRWNNVPATRGRIMTLLVKVKVKNHDLNKLQHLIRQIETLVPQANPVRVGNLPLTWPPQHLGTELAYRVSNRVLRSLRHAGIWALTGLFSGLVKLQANKANSAAGKYIRGLTLSTDHLKLDDVFRAVLDVTPEESAQLESLLHTLQDQGELSFGLHYSDHALMTCFVQSMEQHIHFVDGGDGGYAVAARQLKNTRPATSHQAAPPASSSTRART